MKNVSSYRIKLYLFHIAGLNLQSADLYTNVRLVLENSCVCCS